ncbi:MAG TPA: peptidylprolyl isomerase [Candidatus Moranbacteria bacterium]|nr:peptidylprolyl isomerase [Candidatus Moranbacteria bacterium]
MEKQKNFDGEKKIRLSTVLYSVLILLVLVIGVCSVLAFGTETEIGKKIATKFSKIVPFPAAVIDHTNFILWNDVEKNMDSIQKFYVSQEISKEGLRIDFTTPNGIKRLDIKKREILDKLVEDKIIEILAKKNGLSISKSDIDKIVNKKLAEYGTAEEIKKSLQDSYGWSLADFKEKVVMPSAYKEALIIYVQSGDLDNSAAKKKIEQAKKELEDGKDFAKVVEKYSNGLSKENGGELGWVKKNQVLSEIQEAIFDSDTPKENSIIESSIGFHIIKIENRKKEENEDVLQLRQIFISKDIFADWLAEQKKKISVIVPLAGFMWDSSRGSIDFRSEEMRNFEKEERKEMKGDASLMY